MKHLALLVWVLPFALASPRARLAGRQSGSCGVKGYNKAGGDAYDYDGTASLANLASCGARCTSQSQCVAFAFGDGACLLYDKSV